MISGNTIGQEHETTFCFGTCCGVEVKLSGLSWNCPFLHARVVAFAQPRAVANIATTIFQLRPMTVEVALSLDAVFADVKMC
jgi:hypothetical protein